MDTGDRDLKEKTRFLEADVQQYPRDIDDLTKAQDPKAARLEELKRQLRSRHHQPSARGRGHFRGLLSDLEQAGKLAWFVVDEAHCVSQDGHDFRPDYGKLHNLRMQYPSVPIMALSATCPPKVLDDLVEVLRLEKPVVSGEDALTQGTVYFTAPLYHKNLHCKVMLKPNKGEDVYQAMVNWILEKHKGKSGIVYCFAREDAETVAEKIQALSKNQIRTGTYHANVRDDEKHWIHEA